MKRIDSTLLAQTDPPPAESVFDIIFAGGFTGFLIVLVLVALSMIALALVVEHLMTLRLSVLAPEGLAERVAKQLAGDTAPATGAKPTVPNLQGAAAACDQQPSTLARVIRPALAEVDGGWPAVEKALEDATADQAARLFRKIEYLSVIGNIAPMVGLLGTVVGMILAFREVAETQGAARAAELASGIYQALVTTVGGLLVAIPSLAAFAVFRNRVDGLVADVAFAAGRATAPLKRRMLRSARRRAEGGTE